MSEPRFLVDPYHEWALGEDVPIHEGFGLDLLELVVGAADEDERLGVLAGSER